MLQIKKQVGLRTKFNFSTSMMAQRLIHQYVIGLLKIKARYIVDVSLSLSLSRSRSRPRRIKLSSIETRREEGRNEAKTTSRSLPFLSLSQKKERKRERERGWSFSRKKKYRALIFVARVNTRNRVSALFRIDRNYTDYPWRACMSGHFEHKLRSRSPRYVPASRRPEIKEIAASTWPS